MIASRQRRDVTGKHNSYDGIANIDLHHEILNPESQQKTVHPQGTVISSIKTRSARCTLHCLFAISKRGPRFACFGS